MLLIPYFEHEIESSKTSTELKELINAYIQQKSEALDGLDLTGNGKDRFIVHSEHVKFLEVHGTVTQRGNYASVRLRFGLRLFTIIFGAIVLGMLSFQLFMNDDYQILAILILFGGYLFNLILFRTTANKLNKRLTRILK